jgi:hypothetical protein
MTPPPETVVADGGRLTVAGWAWPVLQANSLATFDAVSRLPVTNVVRAVPGRSTSRLVLRRPEGADLVAYLKRYEPGYLSAWRQLARRLHWPGAADEAAQEWDHLVRLHALGFRTARPLALGQLRQGGIVAASFLLQEEIPGGLPADEYFLNHLAAGPPRRRWELLGKIGTLVGQFHQAGLVHKDLYFKHLFVVERGADWELYLIDLQRVVGPARHRARWYLKDLAALGFSARVHARLPRTALLRLFHGFTGRPRLTAADKALLRRLGPQVRRLEHRSPKYRRIYNAPPSP